MNLLVSRISNIRWKNKIFENFFSIAKPLSSLPQVRCVRGANIFPSHNQSLTHESLTKTSTSGFPSKPKSNTRWQLPRTNNAIKNHQQTSREWRATWFLALIYWLGTYSDSFPWRPIGIILHNPMLDHMHKILMITRPILFQKVQRGTKRWIIQLNAIL